MLRSAGENTSGMEIAVLRKLRIWIIGLALVCMGTGIGAGLVFSGLVSNAQTDVAVRSTDSLAPFVDIARRVEPAVVNIDTKSNSPALAAGDEEGEDSGKSPADNLLDKLRPRSRRPLYGVGSGFIVDPKGYILTNQHVVRDASRITVRLQSGEEYIGTVVGTDEETDLAVIKVDAPHELPTVKLGDSSQVQVGDWVLAIGSPFGLDQTVTAGIISKLQRETSYFSSFQQFLQTDAAINRGNSGGPLVNLRGDVIGINSQIATSTGDYNGIGFALPSNEAAFVFRQIVAQGKVRRGFLGIAPESVKEQFAKVFELSDSKGAIITDLRSINSEPGPAAKAGLKVGDVIVELNGQLVRNAQDLIVKVASTQVGTSIPIAYLREAPSGKFERHVATVTLAERPAQISDIEEPAGAPVQVKGTDIRLGLKLAELTPQLAASANLTGATGLLVKEIDPNGLIADVKDSAAQIAIRPNDTIARFNRTPVNSLADFDKLIAGLKPGDPVVLQIFRYSNIDKRVVQRVVQFTYQ